MMMNKKIISEKKVYIKPNVRLVVFDYRDVVMASGGSGPLGAGVEEDEIPKGGSSED